MVEVTGGAKTRRAAPAEAEARGVASAQACFPARHAREKRRQKREVIEEIKSDSREGKMRLLKTEGLRDFSVFGRC